MKRGDTVKVVGLGNLTVVSVSGDNVKGRWASGPLKGKEACSSRRALLGQEPAPPPKVRKASKRARAELQEALLTDMKEGPVAVASWAQERGVEELLVRGAIGALRKAGFPVASLGGGKFGL